MSNSRPRSCVTPPQTLEGVEKYLGSGLVKGIGPHFAHKIVEVFGERTLAVIDESPSFLKEVKGIGPRRIQRIREGWRQHKAVRAIMVFLSRTASARLAPSAFTRPMAIRPSRRCAPIRIAWPPISGASALRRPTISAGVWASIRSRRSAPAPRVRFLLQRLSQEGHVAYPEPALLDAALLEEKAGVTDIPAEIMAAAVEAERQAGDIVRRDAEAETAVNLSQNAVSRRAGGRTGGPSATEGDHPLPPSLDAERGVRAVERKWPWSWRRRSATPSFRRREEKCWSSRAAPALERRPLYAEYSKYFPAAACGSPCAPDRSRGQAADRNDWPRGQNHSSSVEIDPVLGGFKRDAGNPLDLDMLVVDEASMVDVALMYQLVRAMPRRACLVLVGDVDQLPSVGPGTVLADVIASGAVPVVRLADIFRQAGQSGIVRAAHAVPRGETPESAEPGGGDFYFRGGGKP